MGCAKARLPCAAFVVRAWAQGGQACRADRVLHRGGRIGGAIPGRRVPAHAGRPRAGRKALARLVRDVADVRGKQSLARLYRGDRAARFTDTGGIGRMTTPSKVYVPKEGDLVGWDEADNEFTCNSPGDEKPSRGRYSYKSGGAMCVRTDAGDWFVRPGSLLRPVEPAPTSPAWEDVCDACGATPVTHRDTIAKDFQPTDLTDRYNFCKACSVV